MKRITTGVLAAFIGLFLLSYVVTATVHLLHGEVRDALRDVFVLLMWLVVLSYRRERDKARQERDEARRAIAMAYQDGMRAGGHSFRVGVDPAVGNNPGVIYLGCIHDNETTT